MDGGFEVDGDDQPSAGDPNRTVIDRIETFGRNSPGQRLFGSMKYPMAYQSFTIDHPVLGSAILGVVASAGLFLLSVAATQGRGAVLLAVVYSIGAFVIFGANWIGAKRMKVARQRSGRRQPNS
jgi:hypothetical protein